MKRAAFLDRDGVLNKVKISNGRPYPPTTLKELMILEGVAESLSKLRELKFEIVVVSNQPDIARGKNTEENVRSINGRIQELLNIEKFYICPHDDSDDCDCRKPKPGLLVRASQELQIDLKSSFMIGDRWRDVAAGNSAGCKTFFIDYSYKEKQPDEPYTRVASLLEAVKLIEGFENAK